MGNDEHHGGANEDPKQIPGNPLEGFLAPSITANAKQLQGRSGVPDGTHYQILHERNLEVIVVAWLRAAYRGRTR